MTRLKVGYFIPTYNQYEWVISKHLPSIDTQSIDYVRIHYNGFDDLKSLESLPTTVNDKPLSITCSSNNLGVSGAWNLFCRESILNKTDVAIIANDDIIVYEQGISRLLDAVRAAPNSIAAYSGKNAFSLFALPLAVYKRVGGFDEGFWPAYFEDNDYVYRMKLLGMSLVLLENQEYFHKGSATMNSYSPSRLEQHHNQFRQNERYYIQKWGGLPGNETVT